MEYEKPNDAAFKQKLTPRAGTELAFANEYWDNRRAGIYVDIVSEGVQTYPKLFEGRKVETASRRGVVISTRRRSARRFFAAPSAV